MVCTHTHTHTHTLTETVQKRTQILDVQDKDFKASVLCMRNKIKRYWAKTKGNKENDVSPN